MHSGFEIDLNVHSKNGFSITGRKSVIHLYIDKKPARIFANDGDKLKKGKRHIEKHRLGWYYDKEIHVCVIQIPKDEDIKQLKVTF